MDVFGKMMLALFIPALLVLLFTRITYNRYVALLLAIALIAPLYMQAIHPHLLFSLSMHFH